MPDTALPLPHVTVEPNPEIAGGRSPAAASFGSRFGYYLPILGYHSVGQNLWHHVPTVSAAAFEWQLAFLKKTRHSVLSPNALADLLEAGRDWPRNATAITFDDGYEDNWTVAWPLLKDHGFPAIVFITPSEIGLPGFMNWDQVRAAAEQGLTIGCHTMNHSYLPSVPDERLHQELVESKATIEREIGRPVDFLSYPIGGFTQAAQDVAKRANYRLAFTTNRRSFWPGVDRWALRRVKITDKDRYDLTLRVKLSGYYDCFRQLRKPS